MTALFITSIVGLTIINVAQSYFAYKMFTTIKMIDKSKDLKEFKEVIKEEPKEEPKIKAQPDTIEIDLFD